MKNIDTNKINFEAMSEALNVGLSQIKLVIKGPRQNTDQQSIEAIQTIEQACKLFKQAKSEQRKNAIARHGLSLCKTVQELKQLHNVVWKVVVDNEMHILTLFRLKYHQLYAQAVPVSHYKQLIGDELTIPSLHTDELVYLCEQDLLGRCDRVKNYEFAMEFTGRYDEGFSFDADPFKLKAAEFANNEQALELLKQVVEGYDDLQPESKLLQILVQKASVLFLKK